MKDKIYGSSHVKEVNSDGSVRFRLTERAVDRQGEVIEPMGVDFRNFKANPIVLFGHGMSNQVPIGKIDMDTIETSEDFIDANVIFHDDGTDPFATMIAEKVRKGFLNAGSIGFRPKTVSDEPVFPNQTGVTHKEWELMEFSIVPIPALPSALAQREWNDFATQCKSYGHSLGEMFEPKVKEESMVTTSSDGQVDITYLNNEKSGKILSRKNVEIVNRAIGSLETALDALTDLLENAIGEHEETNVSTDSLDDQIKELSDSFILSQIQAKLKHAKSLIN